MNNNLSDMATPDNIGIRIKEARIAAGMSMKEVSLATNLSHQQISKYERGIDCIKVERLRQLAKIFNRPLLYFFNSEEFTQPLQRRELEIVRYLKKLKVKEREMVIGMVRTLAQREENV